MSTLTVSGRGQVTLRKQVLQHLGIKPGAGWSCSCCLGARV